MNDKTEFISYEDWKCFLPDELFLAKESILRHLFLSFTNYLENNKGKIINDWLNDGDGD
jgi:hypothetical protein